MLSHLSFVDAVVGQLGECYQDQQMFTEAESLYQTQLSLLYDMPGDNTEAVAAGQTYLLLLCSMCSHSY